MTAMTEARPKSVGLGGDGDEVFAIQEVERVFGASLDYDDAHGWATAGDVYTSLCDAITADEVEKRGGWRLFAETLADETGVDPNQIVMDSPLLSYSGFWVHVSNASALLFYLMLAGAAIVLAAAVFA